MASSRGLHRTHPKVHKPIQAVDTKNLCMSLSILCIGNYGAIVYEGHAGFFIMSRSTEAQARVSEPSQM